jgi:predicted amidophosphoribosyltransferase
MPRVLCPSCGQEAEFEAMQRTAEEFCSNCDFPLFWARNDLPRVETVDAADSTRRRLPGAAGRLSAGHKPCPSCREPNLLDVRYCIRCGTDFNPPPFEPEPVFEPVVIYVEPPPPPTTLEPDSPWWNLAVVGFVLVGIMVTLLITSL